MCRMAKPLGMPLGKIERHPGYEPLRGSATIVSRADSWPMAWLPRPSATPAIFPRGYPHSDRHSESLQAPIKVRFLIKDSPPANCRVSSADSRFRRC